MKINCSADIVGVPKERTQIKRLQISRIVHGRKDLMKIADHDVPSGEGRLKVRNFIVVFFFTESVITKIHNNFYICLDFIVSIVTPQFRIALLASLIRRLACSKLLSTMPHYIIIIKLTYDYFSTYLFIGRGQYNGFHKLTASFGTLKWERINVILNHRID